MSGEEYVYRRTPMRFRVVGRAWLDGKPFVHLKPVEGGCESTLEVGWEDFARDYSGDRPATPIREAPPDIEKIARGVYDEIREHAGPGSLRWNELQPNQRHDLLEFAETLAWAYREEAEVATLHPAPAPDVEKLAAAAWQATMRAITSPNEWGDHTERVRQAYIAFARYILDHAPMAAAPASRVGQWLPSRYVGIDPKCFGPVACCVGEEDGKYVRLKSHGGSLDGSFHESFAGWDAAVARWVADGRPTP